MGKRRFAYIKRSGSNLIVSDKEKKISTLWKARFDMELSDEEIAHFDQIKKRG